MPYTFPKLLARSLATSQKADCNFFLFCFVLFFFFFFFFQSDLGQCFLVGGFARGFC